MFSFNSTKLLEQGGIKTMNGVYIFTKFLYFSWENMDDNNSIPGLGAHPALTSPKTKPKKTAKQNKTKPATFSWINTNNYPMNLVTIK